MDKDLLTIPDFLRNQKNLAAEKKQQDDTSPDEGQSASTGGLEAKPCPFCGEESITIHEGSTFRWLVAECNECGATCGEVRVQTSGDGSPGEWKAEATQYAVEEWNKRASNESELTGCRRQSERNGV